MVFLKNFVNKLHFFLCVARDQFLEINEHPTIVLGTLFKNKKF